MFIASSGPFVLNNSKILHFPDKKSLQEQRELNLYDLALQSGMTEQELQSDSFLPTCQSRSFFDTPTPQTNIDDLTQLFSQVQIKEELDKKTKKNDSGQKNFLFQPSCISDKDRRSISKKLPLMRRMTGICYVPLVNVGQSCIVYSRKLVRLRVPVVVRNLKGRTGHDFSSSSKRLPRTTTS